MAAYLTFIKTAFLGMLAYRLRYYTGILTYLFFVGVYYFIWQAVYAGHPEGYQINGFTLDQMLTYIVIGWIARSSYFSNIDDDIDDLVKSGQISIFLLRPLNFQLVMLVQAIGQSLFRILFFSVPVAIAVIIAFPVNLASSPLNLALFILSSTLGFFVMTCFNFIVGLLAFYLKSIDGILRAKYNLINFASGLLLPFSFFPGWLESLMNFLPFKTIAYVPLNFYLGRIPAEQIFPTLVEQFVWLIGLFFLGAWFWNRAVARLTLQGG